MRNLRVDPGQGWEVLREKIIANTPPGSGSYSTAIKGLDLHRHVSNDDPKPLFYRPVIIVVAQGEKLVRIGAEEYHYGENACFVSGVDMPASSCIMQASPERPYLSASLWLDTGLLASLAGSVPAQAASAASPRGAVIQDLDPDLLDSIVRLVELAEKPEQIPVMQDLLLREIHYRLLLSPFGNILRSLNTFGSQGNQITRAIAWLKENYREPLQVEDLASRSNMAASTFHKYFKDITTLSPLQYQKRLRLGEAQQLMLSQGYDVTQAAHSVGYESATQFIREYKRLYGEPPRRNVMRIRTDAGQKTGWAAV